MHSRIIKKSMFNLLIFLWMIYFFDIFSLRAASVINYSKNSIKNTSKNPIHNITFRNSDNHSYFKTILHKSNHNIFKVFHRQKEFIPYKKNLIFYQNLTNDENTFLNRVNYYRSKNNINNLIQKDELSNIANIISLSINEQKDLEYYSRQNNTQNNKIINLFNQYNIPFNKISINIVSTNNIEDGFQTLCRSYSHNNNLLSNDKIYTGISIIDSVSYGKIIVQLFVSY